MLKKKPSEVIKKTAGDIRSSSLQNGLYFFIVDCVQSYPGLDDYLKNLGIRVAHSTRVKLTHRNALFLNLPEEIFAVSIFPAKTGAHLTLDKDYIEFEGDKLADRLKWHYAHYTEDYPDRTVHVYFNSNAHIVSANVTFRNGTSRKLTDAELGTISDNLNAASDILITLMSFKQEHVNICATLANTAYSNLMNTASAPKQAGFAEALIKYQEAQERAQRYADVGLVFSDAQLALDVANYRAQQIAALHQNDAATAAQEITKAAMHMEQERLAAVLKQQQEAQRVQDMASHQKNLDRANNLLSSGDAILKSLPELQCIKQALVVAYNSFEENSKDRTITLRVLKKLDGIDNTSAAVVKRLTAPDTITLKFLQDNFKGIEKFLDQDFCAAMLNAAAAAQTEVAQQKFRDICEFLYQNSSLYCDTVKSSNIMLEHENPPSVAWLKQCVKDNNPGTFKMLLKHGVSLDANAMLNPERHDAIAESTFRVLMVYLGEECFLAAPNVTPETAKLAMDKFLAFLDIMTLPEFFAGGEYEGTAKSRLMKSVLAARVKKIIQLKRSVNTATHEFKRDDVTEKFGIFGAFEFAVQFLFHAKILNLLAERSDPKRINLKTLAICLGRLIEDNNFVIVINDEISNAPSFKALSKAEFNADDTSLVASKYEAPASGAIQSRIYVTPLINASEANREFPSEQLQDTERLLANAQRLFTICFEHASASNRNKALEHLLSLPVPQGAAAHNQDKVKEFLNRRYGALVILFAMRPQSHSLPQHYSRIVQCFLDMTKLPPMPIMTDSYFYQINRLYDEVLKMSNPDIAVEVRNTIIKNYSLQTVSDRAEQFTTLVVDKVASTKPTVLRNSP